MKRFNAGVITLLIIAAYFIATAFIPDLYLAFNYKLILALLFVLLSWQSKGKFLFFLGMAFLSTYIHDLFRLDYSEWTLFVGILILGIAVDRLSKPSYKKKFSYKVSKEHEREIFAKTLIFRVCAGGDFSKSRNCLCQCRFWAFDLGFASGSVYDGPTSDCGSGKFFSGYHSSAQGLASGYTRASYKPSRSERLR